MVDPKIHGRFRLAAAAKRSFCVWFSSEVERIAPDHQILVLWLEGHS
jgi:hypothetical protein